MKLHQHYTLTLTFAGPLLTQTTGTMALGLDVEMQKNADNTPVINGSLIKGNLRHTLTEFSELLDDKQLETYIDQWFGKETSDSQYTPQRTLIDFDFFWQLQDSCQKSPNPRTRIAIDPTTGTVKDGALQIAEDCFPLGSNDPVFSGKITTRLLSKEQKKFEQWINKAIQYIPAMGSFKGVGWGKLISAELKPYTPPTSSALNGNLPEHSTRFGLQLEIDRPFCLGRPRTPESNIIVSEDFIAGNVIKGLIARLYNNDAELLEQKLCFDKLIITHALAAKKTDKQRNAAIPLSLAIIETGKSKMEVVDMAGLQSTEKINWKNAPIFAPDWKKTHEDKINTVIQSSREPDRLLVLRTEINKKGISEEGKLFSLECVEPKDHLWLAEIELVNVPEEKRQAVLKELHNKLQPGLYGLGKTKAHAKLAFMMDAPYKTKTDKITAGRQIVTLTTAARILPPDLEIQGTNSAKLLKAIYQDYWQNILSKDEKTEENVKLENYFAQQSLTSTNYHQQRHQQIQNAYYPEWLTDAGSVFVLNVQSSTAIKKLKEFATAGLPAHPELDGTAANWETTPFLPEHGYGEIDINNPTQIELLYQYNEEAK